MTNIQTSIGALRVLANVPGERSSNDKPKPKPQCNGGTCPTVYEFKGDDILVQGYQAGEVFDKGFIPQGEDVVRIPRALLRQLVERGEI